MIPIKFRHIILGLVVGFIIFLFYRIGDEDYSYGQSGTHPHRNIPTLTFYNSLKSEQTINSSSKWSHNPLSSTRHEILQTKVKGYREETYWGEEHPIHEKIQQMSEDEFDDFIEEVEINDADV